MACYWPTASPPEEDPVIIEAMIETNNAIARERANA